MKSLQVPLIRKMKTKSACFVTVGSILRTHQGDKGKKLQKKRRKAQEKEKAEEKKNAQKGLKQKKINICYSTANNISKYTQVERKNIKAQ